MKRKATAMYNAANAGAHCDDFFALRNWSDVITAIATGNVRAES
jgi:hypothetical protein